MPQNGSIRTEKVIDPENDHYELLHVGWDGPRRIHGSVIHIDIIDGKVCVEHDGTDAEIVGDIEEAGIPKFFQAQFPALEKAVPAMVASPQSFGSLLNVPHCHALSPLGLFTRDGVFHQAPEDLDFSPLEALFREELFKRLLKKEKITPERIELLRSWRHSGLCRHQCTPR